MNMKKLLKTLAVLSLATTLVACSNGSSSSEDKTIKVGATLVPHAEILKEVVAPVLEKEGWKLEVVEFNDYVTPASSRYAALNSKNRYMLLEWKDSYLEALSDPEVITYTIGCFATGRVQLCDQVAEVVIHILFARFGTGSVFGFFQ